MKKKTKFQNFGKEATQFLVGVAGQKPKAVDAANAAKAWMLRVNRIITYIHFTIRHVAKWPTTLS